VPVLSYVIVAVAAYLLGSIPTGYLVGRTQGIDIRTAGSGNMGATNSFRVLGKPAGTFVLLVDCAKGFAAVWLGGWLWKVLGAPEVQAEPHCVVAGILAVLGHNYPCWLRFKGGKGIATSAGVYLALAPVALGITLVVFILTVAVTRYVSIGSIVGAIVLPSAVWFTHDNWTLRIVTMALGVLAIFKHRKNIQRLMAGTENRIGKAPQSTEAAK